MRIATACAVVLIRGHLTKCRNFIEYGLFLSSSSNHVQHQVILQLLRLFSTEEVLGVKWVSVK
jgi:hypothetical protein